MSTPKVDKPTEFIRCPGCGKFSLPAAFERAANEGHVLELGRPTGKGPWARRDLPDKDRRLLAALFREIANRLDGGG